MRRYILGLAALGMAALGAVTTLRSDDRPVHAAICNTTVPLGAIPPAVPEWCKTLNTSPVDTHVESANAWVDDFNHGQTHAVLNSAYARGAINNSMGCDILHFQHNNHWMADIQGMNGQWPGMCGAWMRPNRTFTAVNGVVVLEFEFAGPIAGTRDAAGISDSWPEFTFTADPAPGLLRQNGTYIYETFAGYWAFGCRMQQSKHPICSLYQPTDGPPARPQREWEINQNGGDVAYEVNGGPHAGLGDAIDRAWKSCTSTQDPDTLCRNHFRVELTATRMKLFVKEATTGQWVLAYEAGFINDHVKNIIDGQFFVYLGDFAYRIENDVVMRFHWDHFAINPEVLGPVIPPTPTSTPVATNTPTATPTPGAPTNTPTPTPPSTTTQTVTFNDKSGTGVFSGQYPTGLINWGSSQWYLSGPWSVHTSKSISFSGSGVSSRTFSFVSPKKLVSLRAGGISSSTITLSCAGNPTKTQSISANVLVTVNTGWTVPCTTVTVGSSNGWDTNFDDLVVQ